MTLKYDPPKHKTPIKTGGPMEVELVQNIRACGTCDFFWPEDPADQVYGPYPLYDFKSNYPTGQKPVDNSDPSYWMKVTTRESGFPNGEVMDGCRKAPIMTIGINPNMTAFAPGRTGTSWAYPVFSSDNNTNAAAKYAYYYRYRNVYQECFDFYTVKDNYLLDGSSETVNESGPVTADKIKAAKSGYIVSATRLNSGPDFDLVIKYDSEKQDITITLHRDKGKPRYVLLFDHFKPYNEFKEGEIIAAKMDIPAGESLDLYEAEQTYYEQFVRPLNIFNDFLVNKGHTDASLKIGEDVCQLDMVACASPHWNSNFLGGYDGEKAIIYNCVSKNSWAIKQLIQTRPAVLFLVGESSYNMFNNAFGNLIKRNPPLPSHLDDNVYTLFRQTTDSKNPTIFHYETTIDGQPFTINTRLIVTPHFSYDDNFYPQFRMSKSALTNLTKRNKDCAKFLTCDPRITFTEGKKSAYDAFDFTKDDAPDILTTIQKEYPDCWQDLEDCYYDGHQMMADVMEDLYQAGTINYKDADSSNKGFLNRTDGSCHFCTNDQWQIPAGCKYKKTEQEPPPAGFLDSVAAEIVKKGGLTTE